MRIEELIDKLKKNPGKYESVVLKVYKELKSDLRQALIFIYGIPALICTIASVIKGTILIPILTLILLLYIALVYRFKVIEDLLEEVRRLLIGDNDVDENTRKFLKENWLLLLYGALGFIFAILIGFGIIP